MQQKLQSRITSVKSRSFSVLCFALILGFFVGLFEVGSVQADSQTAISDFSQYDFLNRDGTLRLDGSYSGSIDLQGWNVQLDPEQGPIFTSVQATPLPGWSALGVGIGGNGPLSDEVWAIIVNGSDVYVGGFLRMLKIRVFLSRKRIILRNGMEPIGLH